MKCDNLKCDRAFAMKTNRRNENNDAPWFHKSRTNLVEWEHNYFCYWSPAVNCCHSDVSADARVKDAISASLM